MNAELRVALVGYGLSGRVFHAPLIVATPGLQLVSVVTGNPERQALARQDLSGIEILPAVDGLWRRAADHDLVVVASPTGTHLGGGEGCPGGGPSGGCGQAPWRQPRRRRGSWWRRSTRAA